jgi:hypothetical protein
VLNRLLIIIFKDKPLKGRRRQVYGSGVILDTVGQ